MPDITMCSGENCPNKDKCYRHTATPTPRRQSFFIKAPVLADGTCEYFADNSKRGPLPPCGPFPDCDHGVVFDKEAADAENLNVLQIRERFPRLDGPCPKGCGFTGIAYASRAHLIYGDW